MKRIVIASIVIALLIAVLLVLPLFIQWDSYKQAVITSVKELTGREVVVSGAVTGTFLPHPSITVSNIAIANMEGSSAEDMVKAKAMQLRLSLLALLQGKIGVASVRFEEADIQLERLDNGKKNWGLLSADKHYAHLVPGTVSLVNSTVTFRKNSSQFLKSVKNVNAVIDIDSLEGPFSIVGDVTQDNEKIAFNATIDNFGEAKETAVSLEVVTNAIRASFEGKLIPQATGRVLVGKVKSDIDNIKEALHRRGGFLRALPIDIKEAATATFDFKYADKEMSLDNITLTSENLKGTGKAMVSFEATPVVDVMMNFDMINLDGLLKGKLHPEVVERDGRDGIMKPKVKYLAVDMSKNINFLVYLTANKILYNQQAIENVVINADLFNGRVEIYPSTAQLPGNGKLEVSGNISSNEIRPVFEGSIVFKGDSLPEMLRWWKVAPSFMTGDGPAKLSKFDIRSQLSITPQEIRFTHMDALLAGANVGGAFYLRYGNDMPEINANLNISTLNLDAPLIASWRHLLLQPFVNKADDEVGADFQWLRKLSARIGAELTVGELRYNQRVFKHPSFVLHLFPGGVQCDRFAIASDIATLEGDAMIDIRALRPKVTINLKGEKLDMAVFSIPENTEAKENLALPPVIPGVGEMPPEEKKMSKWSDAPFNFLRFDKFSGTIRADLDSFIFGGVPVSHLTFASRLSDGALVIDNLKGELFNGKLLAKGALGSLPPSLSVSFSLSNGLLTPFLKTFSSIDSLSGYFSLSGSFATQGTTPANWASVLESGVSVAVRDMKMQNFDLDSVIASATSEEALSDASFDAIVANVFTKGETLFNNIDGNLSVDKGILQVSGLNFGTVRTQGVLSGSMDVKNWLLNMASQIAFIPRQGAKPLTLGITMTGSVDNPEKKIDVSAVKTYVQNKLPAHPVAKQNTPATDEWGDNVKEGSQPEGIPDSAVSVVPAAPQKN